MKNLNDVQGLQIAIQIEARGKEFYREAYEQAIKPEHKELFQLLMNEETHHMQAFREIFDNVSGEQNAQTTDNDFDPKVSRYLSVLAESHIFPQEADAKAKIAELKSLDAILQVAIQAEKDSVLFYAELALNAKFPAAQKIFAALKAEEQEHVVKLKEMIDAWA